MTFTGLIGRLCMYPLQLIIRACVRLRIHPNVSRSSASINIGAAWALGLGSSAAGVIMVVNIFDPSTARSVRGSEAVSAFGGFWDSVIDRFSDLALFLGLIYLYTTLGRTDYVMIAALAMIFSIMTSYTRARAESLIKKCKVGFMERPERIVLFMIGAFTNRMAGVLWVILVLSVVTVADRIIHTYRELREDRREAIA
jgi:CDP-diacylglycerol--glycerol-3-phosphate 3-phosphatidyltransferase